MSWRWKLPTSTLLATVINLTFSAQSLLAVDCSTPLPGLGMSQGSFFSLAVSGFTVAEVEAAADYWECPRYSEEIPGFEVDHPGGVPVLVVKVAGNAPQSAGGCGLFSPEAPRGYVESATITVWTNDSNGEPCPVLLSDVLAHELGHLLGLANAPHLDCVGHIMGLSYGGGNRRTVYTDDCAVTVFPAKP